MAIKASYCQQTFKVWEQKGKGRKRYTSPTACHLATGPTYIPTIVWDILTATVDFFPLLGVSEGTPCSPYGYAVENELLN